MKKSTILIALLGIVIGLLLAVLYGQIRSSRRNLRLGDSHWRKIELILESIDRNYVDSIDYNKVNEAVAAAALSALDPHSAYMPPQILRESEEDLMGNFDGIGIQFNVPNDTAVVIDVIPGGPSEKIGMQAGDRLLKVDSTNIAGVHQGARDGQARLRDHPVRDHARQDPHALHRRRLHGERHDGLPAPLQVLPHHGAGIRAEHGRTGRPGHARADRRPARQHRRLPRPGLPALQPVPAPQRDDRLPRGPQPQARGVPGRRPRALPGPRPQAARGRRLRLVQRDPRRRPAGQRARPPLRPPHLRQGPRPGALFLQ